jgi:miniconductance mechanosensitive channel
MNIKSFFNIKDWLLNLGLSDQLAIFINTAITLALIVLLAFISDIITKQLILRTISIIVKRSKNTWDDIFLEKKVFNRLSHFAPALVIHYTIEYALADYPSWIEGIQTIIYVYMIFVALRVFDSFANAMHGIYKTLPSSKDKPIKGYIQVVKILVYFIAILYTYGLIFEKEIGTLIAGLGALAAVLLLIFKDTILGLVAGVQLSGNDMVRIGDWVEMPKYGADGDVIEISLHTVKIQNWDKTISTIPTYALVSDSFVNWRGMQESGGRRIKRHINIDMKSVKFCDEEMITKFKQIQYLSDYIDVKREEIEKFNKEHNVDLAAMANGRRITNLGTFRKYCEFYLKNHPKIHDHMTFLVRQLQPTEKGLPLEIYVFSNDKVWANYEAIQADILDHVLAILPEFDLRVFQTPSGNDISEFLQVKS